MSQLRSIRHKSYLALLMEADVRETVIVSTVSAVLALQLRRNAADEYEAPRQSWPANRAAPLISVIVPMRDEAANVAGCIGSLLAQDYPNFELIAVDDGSTDGTGALLARFAANDTRLRVVSGQQLPQGWTGKNWALAQGCAAAGGDWLLCVDADTRHDPLCIASALLYAEREGADMLTLLPRLDLHSFWEKLLVPHSGELYSLLVGLMSQVNDPRSKVAAANGQFIMIRRAVYAAIGTQAAVRDEVAEDWALAVLVKGQGYRLRMAQGRDLVRARVYASLPELWRGFSKTLFPAAGRSLPKVALTIAALTMYGVLPFARLLLARSRRSRLLTLLQIAPILLLRAAIARHLGLNPAFALTYPLAVVMGDGMLLWSAYRYLSGRGMRWKGRNYG